MPPRPRPPRKDGRPKGSPVEKGKHPGLIRVPADSPTGEGAPQIVIDEKCLYEVALTHASYEQMGRILGCSGQYLNAHPGYREIILKARAEKQKDLLSAQFSTAITDRNPTMLIWLGKQYLGQKDVQRIESTGADGAPQKVEHQFKAVAYFPENNRNKRLPSATVVSEDGKTEEVEVTADADEAEGDARTVPVRSVTEYEVPVRRRRRRAS